MTSPCDCEEGNGHTGRLQILYLTVIPIRRLNGGQRAMLRDNPDKCK